MFVVRPDFEAQTWGEFVALAKAAEKPLRIGYKSPVACAKVIFEEALRHDKSPVACAKVIFEEALRHEGITFGGDPSRADIQVHMVNVKGGGKLNVALSGGLIDGYAGNNPFPAIAVEKKMGRIICDLEDLPPGTFRNHPCCCIAANERALAAKTPSPICLCCSCRPTRRSTAIWTRRWPRPFGGSERAKRWRG